MDRIAERIDQHDRLLTALPLDRQRELHELAKDLADWPTCRGRALSELVERSGVILKRIRQDHARGQTSPPAG